jgi:general secretion pathway protein A
VWWVKVDEADRLEKAYNVLRDYPENASDLRLIPHWTAAGGTQFSVVLNRLFTDEQTARDSLASIPAGFGLNSRVVSGWDRQSVYFADPYFGR